MTPKQMLQNAILIGAAALLASHLVLAADGVQAASAHPVPSSAPAVVEAPQGRQSARSLDLLLACGRGCFTSHCSGGMCRS